VGTEYAKIAESGALYALRTRRIVSIV
jgi:hypothetical protein